MTTSPREIRILAGGFHQSTLIAGKKWPMRRRGAMRPLPGPISQRSGRMPPTPRNETSRVLLWPPSSLSLWCGGPWAVGRLPLRLRQRSHRGLHLRMLLQGESAHAPVWLPGNRLGRTRLRRRPRDRRASRSLYVGLVEALPGWDTWSFRREASARALQPLATALECTARLAGVE